jgi:hypothetical protein
MLNYIYPYLSMSFKWGEIDCAHFAADLVKQTTGKDYLKNFRRKYNDQFSAYRLMRKLGYNNIIEAVSGELKKEPQQGIEAVNGDIVAHKVNNEYAIGICYNNTGFFMSNKGIIKIPLEDCEYSWDINGRRS